MAARIPMPSLEPGLPPGHQADGLAAQGHLVPGSGERLGGGDDLVDRRPGAGRRPAGRRPSST